MTHQIGMQLGSLPIQIIFDSSGMIGFVRMANFPTIIDQPEEGVQAIISNEDIYIGSSTQVEYNTLYSYKDMPELLSWLVALKMDMPHFN